MYPIYAFGSDEQKQTWLPAMQKGEKLGCFGLTEPDFGSNPGGMRTRAKKVGNEYVLNGEKMWITSGTIADVAIIWAKVEDEEGSRPRLSGRDRSPRLQGRRHSRQVVAARIGDFGPVAAGRAHARIESAAQDRRPEVSADVPEPGALRHRMGSDRRGHGLLRLRAAILPAPQAVPRSAHRLAPTRAGKTDLDDQRDHQGAVAGLASRPSQRRRTKSSTQHISMAKRNNVWMALECARLSRDILGANGVADDYPIMRHMMNLESVKTYEGTHDVHSLIIGQSITGIDAF